MGSQRPIIPNSIYLETSAINWLASSPARAEILRQAHLHRVRWLIGSPAVQQVCATPDASRRASLLAAIRDVIGSCMFLPPLPHMLAFAFDPHEMQRAVAAETARGTQLVLQGPEAVLKPGGLDVWQQVFRDMKTVMLQALRTLHAQHRADPGRTTVAEMIRVAWRNPGEIDTIVDGWLESIPLPMPASKRGHYITNRFTQWFLLGVALQIAEAAHASTVTSSRMQREGWPDMVDLTQFIYAPLTQTFVSADDGMLAYLRKCRHWLRADSLRVNHYRDLERILAG